MADENREFNISGCLADKTEIPNARHTFLWSKNAMETKLVTVCFPTTKFAEIFKMAFKIAAENRKLNISDFMADKTEIASAQHTFLWSSIAMETKPITMFSQKFAELFKMASKMAAENRKFNISDYIADKTEISSANHTFLWSMNAMETKIITMFAEIFNMASKMAADNGKLNISDRMADKTYIQSAKHTFCDEGMQWKQR